MNVKLVRTLLIAVLMIASSQVAMMEGLSDTELKEENRRMHTVMAPIDQDTAGAACTGDDACTGADAGMDAATIIDLTDAAQIDFEPQGTNFVISGQLLCYGSFNACWDGDDGDVYKLSVPWGYGVDVDLTWEDSPGLGSSTEDDIYRGAIYTCDDDFHMSLSTSGTIYGDCMIDATEGEMAMDQWGWGMSYTPLSPLPMTTNGTDVGGQDIYIQVDCYDCGSYSSFNTGTYELEIALRTSDGGTGTDYGTYASTPSPGNTLYSCNHLLADADACIALPDMIAETSTSFTGAATGWDETATADGAPAYGGAWDSYTIDIPDDTDLTVTVTTACLDYDCGVYIGQYIVFNEAHLYYDGSGDWKGHQTGEHINDAGFTGWGGMGSHNPLLFPSFSNSFYMADAMRIKSWTISGDDADTIDIGIMGTNLEDYLTRSIPVSGINYQIELDFAQSANAPCATSDDGHSGEDASDKGFYVDGEIPVAISNTGSQITGTICQDYDNNDFYSMTVPSGFGVTAVLEWDETTDDQSVADLDGLDFELFVDDGYSYDSISEASKNDANPQVVNSNKTLLFMPAGGAAVTDTYQMESFGSTDDQMFVDLVAGDELVFELETRAYGSEVYVHIDLPDTTTYSQGPYLFANNNYYTANWPTYTDPGRYTITVGDTYGDGCTCTLFVEHTYTPADVALPDNDVVFQVSVDELPLDAVLNYTITYELFEVTTHQFMTVNDAHFGGDVTPTSPGQLYSANYTYTGYMHDWWDKEDSFEIFLPYNYGMSVYVYSDVKNDIDISSSFSNDLDGADPAGPASKTFNGEASGTLETIDLEMVVGSGMYEMVISMWTTDSTPSTDDDAGTGGDAADHYHEWAVSRWSTGGLKINEGRAGNGEITWLNDSFMDSLGNPFDATITGSLNHAWDRVDAYRLAIPDGYYANVSVDGERTGVRVYIFDNTDYSQPFGRTNDEIIASGSLQYSPLNTSTAHAHEGEYIVINIWSYTLSALDVGFDYTINVEWDDIANRECDQDDAGTCDDAPDSYADCLSGVLQPCTAGLVMDSTIDVEHSFTGWAHTSEDRYDQYQIDVPADYGLSAELSLVDDQQDYEIYLHSASRFDHLDTAFGSTSAAVYPLSVNTSDASYLFEGGEKVVLTVHADYQYTGYPVDGYEVTYRLFDLDTDDDGWYDMIEDDCTAANTVGTIYNTSDAMSYPPDNDADSICDELDPDDDNDGSADDVDAFPFDDTESTDTDGDNIGDNTDDDIDNDTWSNADEVSCLTDPYDSSSVPIDSDSDSICDPIDEDIDGDGVTNVYDYYPLDGGASVNTDGDLFPDEIHAGWTAGASAYTNDPTNSVFETTLTADDDDDGDTYLDALELTCLTDPLDDMSIPIDLDGDGNCDPIDDDRDGDLVDNDADAFPDDPCAHLDFDNDGRPDDIVESCSTNLVEDVDDDNDGFLDSNDAFDLDASEWFDTDGDEIGDNSDLNDDGDAWSDSDEIECGSDPLDSNSMPLDFDADNLCDKVDPDDDGDGFPDVLDAFPLDANENSDNDFDTLGDYEDTDDDNDGWTDVEEPSCGTDPMNHLSVPLDLDNDHLCDDVADTDDDNDGVLDVDDAFPNNPRESNDNDNDAPTSGPGSDGTGYGDNSDSDDDNDGWTDLEEVRCADLGGSGDSKALSITPADLDGDGLCDAIDDDDDGDGYPDPVNPNEPQEFEDFFPRDATEWHDNNGDGVGDVGTPLTLMDDIEADPAPFAGVSIVVLAGIALIARSSRGGVEEDDDLDMYDETDEFLDEEYDEEEVEA